MFINVGARDLLLRGERQKFLEEEWPRVQATIQRLGLKAEELLNGNARSGTSSRAANDLAKPDAAKPDAAAAKAGTESETEGEER